MSGTPNSPDMRRSSGSTEDSFQQTTSSGRAAASEAGAQVSGTVSRVKDEAAGAAADLKAEGAELVESAKDRALGFAEEQKRLGADQAEGLARAVHGAADQLKQTSPQIAQYVHEAASALDGFSRTLRERSSGELMQQVEDLARRQPVAFFGAAVLAGFALARFAKSSARNAQAGGSASPGTGLSHPMPASAANDLAGRPAAAAGAPGWVSGDAPHRPGGAAPRPATMPAATLGGAAAQPGAAGSMTGPQDGSR